jgi:MFS family permease
VYQVVSVGALIDSRKKLRAHRVSPNVVLIGVTSMLTDISSEMVATILPMYLFFTLGLSPVQFGTVDGLYQGSAAAARVAGGLVADRWHRHKQVAAAGYALSAVCKVGLLAVGGAWTALVGVILLDRAGKGIRTAPRDALISLSASRDGLGTAFGIHRSLDTVGAMVGPLLAVAILALIPGGFDVIFVVSFCAALLGLGVFVLFVGNRRAATPEASVERISLRAVTLLLAAPRFRALVAVSAALGLTTISDAFIYVALQRRLDFSAGLLPLLYVATAVVFMLLAAPLGRLADRVGRLRVLLGGYFLLMAVYTSLLLPPGGLLQLVGYLTAFGTYYAATDGVLMALGSSVLPPELRASGLAVLATASGLCRLLASVVFGALWTFGGVQIAVICFAGGLSSALLIAWFLLRRHGGRSIYG